MVVRRTQPSNLRDARAQSLHSTTERTYVVGFHDEMCVISLNRVVAQSKVASFAAGREATLELANHLHRS
jgi:hypothetical protein